jgi:hypothetical protein
MKPFSAHRLARVHSIIAGRGIRDIEATLTGTILTITDPVGGIHTTDWQSIPGYSAQSFFDEAVRTAFQNYAVSQIAPAGFQRHSSPYPLYSWRKGAYTLVAAFTRWSDGTFEACLHAFDNETITEAETSVVHDGSARIKTSKVWPQPEELRPLADQAIECFRRFQRFEAFLNDAKIEYRSVSYRVELPPLSIGFENNQPSLKFIRFHTTLLEESLKAHLLVKQFMAIDSKRTESTTPTSISPMTTSLNLV